MATKKLNSDRPKSPGKRAISVTRKAPCLDPMQLAQLEKSFREWAGSPLRTDLEGARKRILLIFLLIRYTGAKLNEVLSLDPLKDIQFQRHVVTFGRGGAGQDRLPREVQISEALSSEIRSLVKTPIFRDYQSPFQVDPGHVRRKFYDRAESCGFPKNQGSPDGIRKARAVELMQSHVPLPAVQKIMGHSTPNLVSSLVSFSDRDIRQMTRLFFERESTRKTSARNAFFGKIRTVQRGDIQSRVELVTLAGDVITTVITNESLSRLGLKEGTLVTAEVKAPQVVLYRSEEAPPCTAENRLKGRIVQVHHGSITKEYVVRIADGTTVCSLVTTRGNDRIELKENDFVWAAFNSFSVILHLE
jgi:molybdate transport system regulatory protein